MFTFKETRLLWTLIQLAFFIWYIFFKQSVSIPSFGRCSIRWSTNRHQIYIRLVFPMNSHCQWLIDRHELRGNETNCNSRSINLIKRKFLEISMTFMETNLQVLSTKRRQRLSPSRWDWVILTESWYWFGFSSHLDRFHCTCR